MSEQIKAQEVLSLLREEYNPFVTDLHYREDWQLLVAVVLSAQTTDANINRITPKLFHELPTTHAIAKAPLSRIEKLIFSSGYYKAKAKHVKALCKELVARNNVIPDTIQELVTLPGVGRKQQTSFYTYYLEKQKVL